MKQYLDLLRHVMEDGTPTSDRTGTGTVSVFGTQTRYDLSKGFPLLTTKKMHLIGSGFGVGFSWAAAYFETDKICIPNIVEIL